MQDETAGSARTPTKVDIAASAACTRSGAFALALSTVLMLLVPYWNQLPAANALSDYIIYRFELTVDLDRLDRDPFWQHYEAANPNAESVGIGKLPSQVPYSPPSNPSPSGAAPENSPGNLPKSAPRKSRPPSDPSDNLPGPSVSGEAYVPDDEVAQAPVSPGCPGGPSLPKGVRVPVCPGVPTLSAPTVTINYSVPELPDIISVLKGLNKPDLLTKGRFYSNFYDFSIERWSQRRAALIYQSVIAGTCLPKAIEEPHKGPPPNNFVPEINADALVNCLSLKDVRELAAYELPIIENPDQIGRGIQRPIDVGLSALPRGIVPASIVAEALLVFALLYFGVFVREAAASGAFPAAGTLFGAFSRSRFALSVMMVLIGTPIASSFAVAVASDRWFLYAGILSVALATWFIFTELHQKGYFNRLKPPERLKRMIQWRRRKPASGSTVE